MVGFQILVFLLQDFIYNATKGQDKTQPNGRWKYVKSNMALL
jgi:hypothetical protein